MKENYEVVPNIITGKDLDYLSDMFNWNYEAYKKTYSYVNEVKDEEIKQVLEKATNTFHSTLTSVLNILKNGGNNE